MMKLNNLPRYGRNTIADAAFQSFAQTAGSNPSRSSFNKERVLQLGAPDYSKIQESDYLPAIEAAVQNSIPTSRRL